jgi:hypothetical protein
MDQSNLDREGGAESSRRIVALRARQYRCRRAIGAYL